MNFPEPVSGLLWLRRCRGRALQDDPALSVPVFRLGKTKLCGQEVSWPPKRSLAGFSELPQGGEVLQLPNQTAIICLDFFFLKVPKISGSVTTETNPKFGFTQKLATECFSPHHSIFGNSIKKK